MELKDLELGNYVEYQVGTIQDHGYVIEKLADGVCVMSCNSSLIWTLKDSNSNITILCVYPNYTKLTANQYRIYPKPSILTDEEKEYLLAVIKPFRDRVIYIQRYYGTNSHCINIRFTDSGPMIFPDLHSDTMYKGMEENKKYTLEELGL